MKKIFITALLCIVMIFAFSVMSYSAYNQSFEEVQVDGQNVKLEKIDVLINGEMLNSDVPPLLYQSRTIIPIRFVAEKLNSKVYWDNKSKEATIKTANKNIVIKIDSKYILVNGKNKTLPYDVPAKIMNSRTMIPLRFVAEELGYKVGWDNNLRKGLITSAPIIKPVANTIINIDNKMVDDRRAVIIESTSMPLYNVLMLGNPNRLVLDMLDTSIGKAKNQYEYKTDKLKGVRVSQFEPDNLYDSDDIIVRTVFDLDSNLNNTNLIIEQDQNKIYFYADNKLLKGLNYKNNNDIGRLIIDSRTSSDDIVEYNANTNSLSLIMNSNDNNLNNSVLILNDSMIENIVVKNKDGQKNINIILKNNISYNIKKADNSIELEFKKITDTKNKYTIVVDAGHGGQDPGAISPINGVKEKDLNLKTALLLEEKLKSMGFNVIMTRRTDVLINLYERAYIANRNNADAFISIHYNYNNDSSIDGIQTLYCPSYKSEVKQNDQYPFAEYMHRNLLTGLNAQDKGIKRRPELVVTRETAMDAALLELGFLSNASDTYKVCSPQYRKKIVNAIADAIARKFKIK
ncbi:N-acetylmuramoyl-L-alanine amidase family protein [Clostridiaceae bacterium M8S5]|nr:N-acetylmuramoyl-L-alanine amidase family protein [Clostridiaceae bacterium M8S5]